MSLWWIGASGVLVIGAALVAAIAWRVSSEIDTITRSVVALRAQRAEVAAIQARRVAARTGRWPEMPDSRR